MGRGLVIVTHEVDRGMRTFDTVLVYPVQGRRVRAVRE